MDTSIGRSDDELGAPRANPAQTRQAVLASFKAGN
jgi:hypothetical protein